MRLSERYDWNSLSLMALDALFCFISFSVCFLVLCIYRIASWSSLLSQHFGAPYPHWRSGIFPAKKQCAQSIGTILASKALSIPIQIIFHEKAHPQERHHPSSRKDELSMH